MTNEQPFETLVPHAYGPEGYLEGATLDRSSVDPRDIRRRSSTKNRYSPMVTAMLTSNTMTTCEQVQRIHDECQVTGSKDGICAVAAQYMAMCKSQHQED